MFFRRFLSPRFHRFLPPLIGCAVLAWALSAFSLAPASAALRGRIRGTARDMTRKPVAGLLVRLISSGSGLIHVTNTDDKGIYSFEDVESGTYAVEVSGSGYQHQIKKEINVRPPFRNIVDFSLPPGPMGEEEAASPVVYTPAAGEAVLKDVTGTFTDKGKRPIPDVELRLANPATGAAFRAQSDREGRVLMTQVPSGIYRAVVVSPGYVTVELKEVEVSRTTGLSLNLSLVEYPLRFEGRIEDLIPEEKPVPSAPRPPGA